MNATLRAAALWLLGAASVANAVSMNFDGSFRADASYYQKLGLGAGTKSKAFMHGRALLNPSVLVDDHFSVKGQWSLLTSPEMAPAPGNFTGSGMVVGNGGFVLGDPNTQALVLTRAWLEWTSDVGLFRLGRLPVDWGYGLVWDDGSRDPWDDYQTTLDRIDYRLFLGYLTAGVLYSKPRKRSTLGDTDDAVFFGGFVTYQNPESDLQAGIAYENQWRSPSQAQALRDGDYAVNPTGRNGNPWSMPPGASPRYPLAIATPYPRTNHLIDVFVKKTSGPFQLGGEFAYLTGKSIDVATASGDDALTAFAALGRVSYENHQFRGYVEGLYASGDGDANDKKQNGFLLLHRNRRPGLILGRELLGPYSGNPVGQGSCVAYSPTGTFSGCLYTKAGASYDWSATITTGLDVIYAQKVAGGGSPTNLGVEVDVGTSYLVYQNFTLGANVGVLFPGKGLMVPNPKAPFALRTTALLTF